MKETPKEKLYDKARKMIDLIFDEVYEGGEKEITASYVDPKFKKKHTLTVKVKIEDSESAPVESGIVIETDENNVSP